jgi:hypothetical protein
MQDQIKQYSHYAAQCIATGYHSWHILALMWKSLQFCFDCSHMIFLHFSFWMGEKEGKTSHTVMIVKCFHLYSNIREQELKATDFSVCRCFCFAFKILLWEGCLVTIISSLCIHFDHTFFSHGIQCMKYLWGVTSSNDTN